MDGRDAMLAIGMNGEPLPVEHGFPARLVVPGLYGYTRRPSGSPSSSSPRSTPTTPTGSGGAGPSRAPSRRMTRIDTPRGLAKLAGRPHRRSAAWPGPIHRGIDGGRGPGRRRALAARAAGRGPRRRHLAAVDDRLGRDHRPPHPSPPGRPTATARADRGAGRADSPTARRVGTRSWCSCHDRHLPPSRPPSVPPAPTIAGYDRSAARSTRSSNRAAPWRTGPMEPQLKDLDDASLVAAVGRSDERALQELYERHGACRLRTGPPGPGGCRPGRGGRAGGLPAPLERAGAVRPLAGNAAVVPQPAGPQPGGRAGAVRGGPPPPGGTPRPRDARSAPTTSRSAGLGAHPVGAGQGGTRRPVRGRAPGDRASPTSAGTRYREVAIMLDLPEGTIKSRIRLGLNKLADRLEATGLGARP